MSVNQPEERNEPLDATASFADLERELGQALRPVSAPDGFLERTIARTIVQTTAQAIVQTTAQAIVQTRDRAELAMPRPTMPAGSGAAPVGRRRIWGGWA